MDVLLWGLGFNQPRNWLNRALKSDFVRLLGITASILARLCYEGKAKLYKTTTTGLEIHASFCVTF